MSSALLAQIVQELRAIRNLLEEDVYEEDDDCTGFGQRHLDGRPTCYECSSEANIYGAG